MASEPLAQMTARLMNRVCRRVTLKSVRVGRNDGPLGESRQLLHARTVHPMARIMIHCSRFWFRHKDPGSELKHTTKTYAQTET